MTTKHTAHSALRAVLTAFDTPHYGDQDLRADFVFDAIEETGARDIVAGDDKLVELAKLIQHKMALQNEMAGTTAKLIQYCLAKWAQTEPHFDRHERYVSGTKRRAAYAKLREEKQLARDYLSWFIEALQRPDAQVYVSLEGCPTPPSGDLTLSTKGE